MYFDMTPNPPDLDMSAAGGWAINVDDGSILNPQLQPVIVPPTSDVAQLSGGPPLRVFVVGNLKVGDVQIHSRLADAGQGGAHGIAFLASGDVLVEGNATIAVGTGSIHSASCQGKNGRSNHAQANGACYLIAGGGGGGAASGSPGGVIVDPDNASPIAGGPAFGSDDLQPLTGGCSGGGFDNNDGGDSLSEGNSGGGVIQITSRKSITVSGHLLANGGPGFDNREQDCLDAIAGGGRGGGILLEAPTVALAAMSTLSAAGGDGLGCTPAQATCGRPGLGGTGTAAAVGGGNVNFSTGLGADAVYTAGTGGGSVGRIRINTTSSTFTSDSTAVKNASVTTGTIKTR